MIEGKRNRRDEGAPAVLYEPAKQVDLPECPSPLMEPVPWTEDCRSGAGAISRREHVWSSIQICSSVDEFSVEFRKRPARTRMHRLASSAPPAGGRL